MEQEKNEKMYMSEQDYLIGKGCASVFSDHLKKLVEVDKVFIENIFTKIEEFAITSIVKYVMIEISNYVDTTTMFKKILEAVKKQNKSITEMMNGDFLEKIFTEEELMKLVKKKDKKSLRFIEIYFDKLSDFKLENNKLVNELIIKTLKDKFNDKQILEWLNEKSTETDEKFLTKSIEYIQQNLEELEKITKLNLFAEINLARENERKLTNSIYKEVKDIPEEPIITETEGEKKEENTEAEAPSNIIDADFVECSNEEEKSNKVEVLELQSDKEEKNAQPIEQPKEETKEKEENKHNTSYTNNHNNKDKETVQDKSKDKEPVEQQPKKEEKQKQSQLVEQPKDESKDKEITALLNNSKISKRELEKRLRELGLTTAQIKSLIKQQEIDKDIAEKEKEIEKSKTEMQKIKENMSDEERKKLEDNLKKEEIDLNKLKEDKVKEMTDKERRKIFESKLNEDNIFEEAEKENK